MTQNSTYLALDVGEKRIGVARGDTGVRLAFPVETVEVDGREYVRIFQLYHEAHATAIIVGYPRNQSGEATSQTAYVEKFVHPLTARGIEVIFQDESVTSIMAEDQLKSRGKSYSKADIDALAAALILQDYLETRI